MTIEKFGESRETHLHRRQFAKSSLLTALLTLLLKPVSARADTFGSTGTVSTIAALRRHVPGTPTASGQIVWVAGYYTAGDCAGRMARWDASSTTTDDGGNVIMTAGRSGPGRWIFDVGDPALADYWGAAASGRESQTAINAAITYGAGRGGGVATLDGSRQYHVTASIDLKENVSFDGRGASLILSTFDAFFRGPAADAPVFTTEITASPKPNTNRIEAASTTGLNIGDRVAIALGDNSYDNNETAIYAITAVILGIDGNTLTIDRLIPYAIPITGSSTNKSISKHASYLHDASIRNVNLEGDRSEAIDGGITLFWARNLTFDGISGNKLNGRNMGYGLIGLLQYCENITVKKATLYRNENTGGASSLGRMFNFAGCHGIYVYDAQANDIQSNIAFVEDYCEDINFFNITARHFNNAPGTVLFACIISKIYVENLYVDYLNSYDIVSYGGTYAHPFTKARFRNMTLRGALPRVMPGHPDVTGRIDFQNGADHFLIDLDAQRVGELTFPITGGMDQYFPIEYGFLLELQIYASPDLDISKVDNVWLGTTARNGRKVDRQLVPGAWADITPHHGGIFGTGGHLYGSFTEITSQVRFLIKTQKGAKGHLSVRYRIAAYVTHSNTGTEIFPVLQ